MLHSGQSSYVTMINMHFFFFCPSADISPESTMISLGSYLMSSLDNLNNCIASNDQVLTMCHAFCFIFHNYYLHISNYCYAHLKTEDLEVPEGQMNC